MNIKKPLVSVIITTYRRDNLLLNALDSLTNQTFHDFEVIIIDDNDEEQWSKKTSHIIDIFKSDNTEINVQHIINHPNQGSAKSRNIGIKFSKGIFITFLDDDDIYLPNKIKNQYTLMNQTNADYSITDLSLYHGDGSLCEVRKRDYLFREESSNLWLCHLKYHMTGTSTMMFRKSYIDIIGGFEPIDIGDEYYLMMKAIEANGKFVYVPESNVKAYIHSSNDGLSFGYKKINGENVLYEFKKKYFNKLKTKDIMYIRMRHYAVLSYTYLKMRNYCSFIFYAIMSLFTYPSKCLELFYNRKNS